MIDEILNSKSKYIFILIAILIGFYVLKTEAKIIGESVKCEEMYCVNDTLDNFDTCIDLGFESTGFLSSEHYYLCDGFKVTNTCTNYSKRNVNYTFSRLLISQCRGVKE